MESCVGCARLSDKTSFLSLVGGSCTFQGCGMCECAARELAQPEPRAESRESTSQDQRLGCSDSVESQLSISSISMTSQSKVTIAVIGHPSADINPSSSKYRAAVIYFMQLVSSGCQEEEERKL